MFAMQQHQYVYAAAPAATRQYSGHGTSSAFSSSANPDEDWTKISDLAERRRIQNRIAQRNYRKKLKRRLEDLERRAGTSDGASSSGAEKSASKSTKKSSPKKAAPPPVVQQVIVTPPPKPVTTSQFTPPMSHDDDLLFGGSYDGREGSHTPPMFAYSAYPPPEDMMLAPYGSTAPQQYRPMTTEAAYADWNTAAAAVPVTLPPMTHFHDALKPDPFADDSMMPYMSYGFAANPYDQHSNPNTPPLSHSFDHSANCSDAGYDYPTTPLSMPGSPNLLQN